MKCKVRCLKLELFPLFLSNNLKRKNGSWMKDKLTFITLAPNPACKSLTSPPPLDQLFHTKSGLSLTDKRLADDFQMIGDVDIFLNGAIPPPQSPSESESSPHVRPTTSNVSSLNLSEREWQSQNVFEEVTDSEEDDGGHGDGDFRAEVEIMIAGKYFIISSSALMI